jgi:hypothetical protein
MMRIRLLPGVLLVFSVAMGIVPLNQKAAIGQLNPGAGFAPWPTIPWTKERKISLRSQRGRRTGFHQLWEMGLSGIIAEDALISLAGYAVHFRKAIG